MSQRTDQHHVVIVGGGFGGLYAARALGSQETVQVTLIDKRNFHLFQPLLYQVAMAGLSPGDIAAPLRSVLSRHKNIRVIKSEMVDLDTDQKQVKLVDGVVSYDSLILATGTSHYYFGNDHWGELAPGLKTVEDALEIRRRVLMAFEAAERETDPKKRQAWLTFVVVGGGPTGVELAGALAELAYATLRDDFKQADLCDTKIVIVEGADRILPPFHPSMSAKAEQMLRDWVIVRTKSLVTDIQADSVTVTHDGIDEIIQTRTVLWAAGVQGSPLGKVVAQQTGAELDRAGRVKVNPDMSVATFPNIFVIGDLAHFAYQGDRPLPGVAQVAMQQGEYVAKLIQERVRGQSLVPFFYWDKGNMAVVTLNAAVAEIGKLRFSGFWAWVAWVFIHIFYLIGFGNRVLVMIQWAFYYCTYTRGARLITGESETSPFHTQTSLRQNVFSR